MNPDIELEREITHCYEHMCASTDRKDQREWFSRMKAAIDRRSAARVREMEIAKGLAR